MSTQDDFQTTSERPPAMVLLEMIRNFRVTQLIYVAAKLGIADLLKDGPKNSDELAQAVGAHSHALYRVMRTLASLGIFVEIEAGRFALTPLAAPLQTGIPDSVRAWAIMAVGVATIGTAIFAQDAAGTPATVPGQVHKILVFGGLVPFSILSTLLVGIWSRRAGIAPGFAVYSFVTVGVMVLMGGLGGATVETPYAGLVERISALVIHQWLFILALKLL